MFVPVDVPLVPGELLLRWAGSVIAANEDAEAVEVMGPLLGAWLRVLGQSQPAFCLLRHEALATVSGELENGKRKLVEIFAAIRYELGVASVIEVDAATRAAPDLTEDDFAALERHLTDMSDAAVDTDAFWESHNAFHAVLLAPVLSPRTERLITELWQAVERYLRIVYIETDVLFARSPYDRHRPLLDAARSRSSAEMSDALTRHLESNELEVVKALQQTGGAITPDGSSSVTAA